MKETNNVEQRPSTSLSKGARRNQILRRITVVGVIAAVITAAFAGYCLHRERVEEKQKAEELRKEKQDKMDEQLSALKHLVYILTDSSVENMEELCADTIRHAEELGIYVQISGNLPQYPSYRLLTDRAIRECVTNCARHAHGSTVLVKIEKGANEYSIRITNDGDAPEKNAEEGGGLSALRKAAESEKCIMQVSFSPEFCLVLKMPLTERMGVYGTDTDSRRSEDHAEVF